VSAGDWALAYAGRFGTPVNPRRGRYPLTPHGWKDATTEPDKIIAYWRKHPDALIATPTGVVFVVLDIDRKNGVDGFDTLDRLGKSVLPETPMVHTPNGGLHVYFRVNPSVRIGFSVGVLGPGLDVLGCGTSVALPTPGWGYRWDDHLNLKTTKLMVAPEWFARSKPRTGSTGTLAPEKLLAEACARIRDAGPGSRHGVALREGFIIGCVVARGRLDEATALHELKTAGAGIVWDKSYTPRQGARDLDDAFKAGLRKGGTRR
jgi:hypothetical protein